ncbi:MAG TPA: chlorite dismutase family protein [Bryobacteraceae bacterium]|nr:chlorite dismutase family protein [Bryobacteraceae bacterium]
MDELDIREKGGLRQGQPQISNRRLFMQLLAFGGVTEPEVLITALRQSGMEGVLYVEVNDPRGVALVIWSDDPDYFLSTVRSFLTREPFALLTPKLEYSMLGRTYSIGHEPDLNDWLFNKPRRNATDAESRWAVWYPLRRKGEFSALNPEEQTPILREHGKVGHSFGDAGYAHDIRLACHGLDKNDNDFVIGLMGPDLYPLSACVQAMRETRQTSRYMDQMGPFFLGKAIWQKASL